MTRLHKYPLGLIPYKGLKNEILVDDIIADAKEFFVIRRVDDDISKYIHDLGDGMIVLSGVYIEAHQQEAIDMSMNIVTSKDSGEYIHFLQEKQPACAPWKGENVPIKNCRNFLKFSKSSHFLTYRSSHLHKIDGPYKRKFSNSDAYKALAPYNALDRAFKKEEDYDYQFRLELHHKPTYCNYWHITLDIYAPYKNEEEKTLLKDSKKKWLTNGSSNLLGYVWNTCLARNIIYDQLPDEGLTPTIAYDMNVNKWKRKFNYLKLMLKVSTLRVEEK